MVLSSHMKSKIFSTCILEELWQFVFGNAPEDTARTIASTVDRLNLVDAKCSIWHFVKKRCSTWEELWSYYILLMILLSNLYICIKMSIILKPIIIIITEFQNNKWFSSILIFLYGRVHFNTNWIQMKISKHRNISQCSDWQLRILLFWFFNTQLEKKFPVLSSLVSQLRRHLKKIWKVLLNLKVTVEGEYMCGVAYFVPLGSNWHLLWRKLP